MRGIDTCAEYGKEDSWRQAVVLPCGCIGIGALTRSARMIFAPADDDRLVRLNMLEHVGHLVFHFLFVFLASLTSQPDQINK